MVTPSLSSTSTTSPRGVHLRARFGYRDLERCRIDPEQQFSRGNRLVIVDRDLDPVAGLANLPG